MNLKNFINQFICHNTLIRLWYKADTAGYIEVIEGDKPKMEHEWVKTEYANNLVIGVTDILYVKSHYVEAVNIVIKR